jgi:hypothetical protein
MLQNAVLQRGEKEKGNCFQATIEELLERHMISARARAPWGVVVRWL